MRVMLDRDEKLIMIGCLTVIFTVVLLLLRGLVASLIVIGSVLVSFASTLGLALVIWQHVLGIQLHWSVPVAVFAILISVGADYNLLVASRFKEEMSAGIRTGVIRSIAGTGGGDDGGAGVRDDAVRDDGFESGECRADGLDDRAGLDHRHVRRAYLHGADARGNPR